MQGLQEELEDADIPQMWGGKRTRQFYDGDEERALFELVGKVNGGGTSPLAIPGMYSPVL